MGFSEVYPSPWIFSDIAATSRLKVKIMKCNILYYKYRISGQIIPLVQLPWPNVRLRQLLNSASPRLITKIIELASWWQLLHSFAPRKLVQLVFIIAPQGVALYITGRGILILIDRLYKLLGWNITK